MFMKCHHGLDGFRDLFAALVTVLQLTIELFVLQVGVGVLTALQIRESWCIGAFASLEHDTAPNHSA